MNKKKTIALVAHDNRKADIIDWIVKNYDLALKNRFVCTGTTGKLVEKALTEKFENEKIEYSNFSFTMLKSGPLGGDQQLGAMISEGQIDFLIFLWDPMEVQPHDVDVKALLRIATLYNIPIAINRSSADFIVSSHLMSESYQPVLKDYSTYLKRDVVL